MLRNEVDLKAVSPRELVAAQVAGVRRLPRVDDDVPREQRLADALQAAVAARVPPRLVNVDHVRFQSGLVRHNLAALFAPALL